MTKPLFGRFFQPPWTNLDIRSTLLTTPSPHWPRFDARFRMPRSPARICPACPAWSCCRCASPPSLDCRDRHEHLVFTRRRYRQHAAKMRIRSNSRLTRSMAIRKTRASYSGSWAKFRGNVTELSGDADQAKDNQRPRRRSFMSMRSASATCNPAIRPVAHSPPSLTVANEAASDHWLIRDAFASCCRNPEAAPGHHGDRKQLRTFQSYRRRFVSLRESAQSPTPWRTSSSGFVPAPTPSHAELAALTRFVPQERFGIVLALSPRIDVFGSCR